MKTNEIGRFLKRLNSYPSRAFQTGPSSLLTFRQHYSEFEKKKMCDLNIKPQLLMRMDVFSKTKYAPNVSVEQSGSTNFTNDAVDWNNRA
jgi:hypothetical protein